MNKENWIKLRDTIEEAGPEHFNMENFECDSAFCIIGWAQQLFGGECEWVSLGIEHKVRCQIAFLDTSSLDTPWSQYNRLYNTRLVYLHDVTFDIAIEFLNDIIEGRIKVA